MTGFGYSDVSDIVATAGQAEGVRLYRHPQFSDTFFGRSDKQALADLGVPAQTIAIAFMFPDYPRASDHWDKIDYAKYGQSRPHGRSRLADDRKQPRRAEMDRVKSQSSEVFERVEGAAREVSPCVMSTGEALRGQPG
jgi:hypothetical protein